MAAAGMDAAAPLAMALVTVDQSEAKESEENKLVRKGSREQWI
jgi:hypothetical protein